MSRRIRAPHFFLPGISRYPLTKRGKCCIIKDNEIKIKEIPMFTKETLLSQLADLNIPRGSVVLVHSSLKAIGETENRGQGVLDALIEAFTADGGLLCIPTHTWAFLATWTSPRWT